MFRELNTKASEYLKGKKILITGAAGTIGKALTDKLLKYDIATVRLLDHDEERSFYLGLRHGGDERVRMLLGDIRDRERMRRALQDVDIIFHTAALKHVGMGEYNPFEVVSTNLIALQNLIECAIDASVEKFVFTSSDKAVNPTNVMGGSKFIGERLVTAGNAYRGKTKPIFCSTRFGNVLGSAGSVVPIFQKQIASGGPVTITDQSMTRFFMTLEESVDLLLSACVLAHGGEIFVPKMHSIRLSDLAEGMIELLSPKQSVPISTIGLRSGEKMFEELISENELPRCLETEKLLIVLPYLEDLSYSAHGHAANKLGPADYPVEAKFADVTFSSKTAKPLTREAVRDILRSNVLTNRTI